MDEHKDEQERERLRDQSPTARSSSKRSLPPVPPKRNKEKEDEDCLAKKEFKRQKAEDPKSTEVDLEAMGAGLSQLANRYNEKVTVSVIQSLIGIWSPQKTFFEVMGEHEGKPINILTYYLVTQDLTLDHFMSHGLQILT